MPTVCYWKLYISWISPGCCHYNSNFMWKKVAHNYKTIDVEQGRKDADAVFATFHTIRMIVAANFLLNNVDPKHPASKE